MTPDSYLANTTLSSLDSVFYNSAGNSGAGGAGDFTPLATLKTVTSKTPRNSSIWNAFTIGNNSNTYLFTTWEGPISEVVLMNGASSLATSDRLALEKNQSLYYSVLTFTSATILSVNHNTSFSYTATSSNPGVSFSWSRAAVAGISNGAASGSGATISETLFNTTNGYVDVPYTITYTNGTLTQTQKIIVRLGRNAASASNTLDNLGLTASQTVAAAYSVRKLSSTYAGKAITVRRSSDNTTQDIGFDGSGNLDTASLKTFVGSGNGYVTAWYDQSGQGRDVVQTITSLQPIIDSLGTVLRVNGRPSVLFSNAKNSFLGTVRGVYASVATHHAVFAALDNPVFTSFSAIISNRTAGSPSQSYNVRYSTSTSNLVSIGDSILVNGANAVSALAASFLPLTSLKVITVKGQSTANWNGISLGSNAGSSGTSANGYISESVVFATTNTFSIRRIAELNQAAYYSTMAFTSNLNASTCSGSPFTYTATSSQSGTTFSWTRDAVAGISNSASSGTGATISETLVNTTGTSVNVTYVFTLTNNGVSNTYSVVVSVLAGNLAPQINAITRTICSGVSFTATPVNGTDGVVPTGTSYSWNTPVVTGGLTGGSAQTNQIAVSQTLVNLTNSAQTATYTITPVTSTCQGKPFSLTISVNSNPQINAINRTICSGASFAATPTDGIDGNVPSGTTYSWSTPVVTGSLTGGSAQSNQSSITQTLNNPTNTIQTATYIVTPTTGTCASNSFTVTLTVRPVLTTNLITQNAFTTNTSSSVSIPTILPGSSSYGFQWFSNSTNSNTGGLSIDGATGSTYTVPVSQTAGTRYYYAVVTDSICSYTVTTNVASVLTYGALTVATQPISSQVICNNTSVGLTALAIGGSSNYTYQWFSNNSNSNIGGTAVTGANSSNFLVPATQIPGSRYYYAVITDALLNNSVSTNVAAVITNNALAIATQPVANQSVNNNTGITISTLGMGGSANYTYQWYSNSNNSNSGGTPVDGANSSSFNIPGTTIGGINYYYAQITDQLCLTTINSSVSAIKTLGVSITTSDTAALLSAYVKKSDTASMLFPYIKKTDAANTYATIVQNNFKLNITDTANMLSGYARVGNIGAIAVGGKMNYTDTAFMLNPYLRKDQAGSVYATIISNNGKLNISDTSKMLTGYAKITAIPVVTGKVNFTDTASMLSKYLRKSDTASIVGNYLRKSDTALMLNGYIRKNTLSASATTGSYNDLLNKPQLNFLAITGGSLSGALSGTTAAFSGNLTVQKLTVTQKGWSDFVFNKAYKLKPLAEVEAFIKSYQHLPDVPSAKEVEEKGISVGDNQAVLLRKIEELTLYMIEMKKENELIKSENEQMKMKNKALEKRVGLIEKRKYRL